MREGGCFGELALLRSDVRAATVKATSDSTVLTLSRDQFTRLLGNLTQLRNIWRFEVSGSSAPLGRKGGQRGVCVFVCLFVGGAGGE